MTKPSSDWLLDQILDNPIYLPDSDLVNGLRKALSQLSKDNLNRLLLVIEMKNASPVERFLGLDK